MIEQTNLVPRRRFKEFQNTHNWGQRKFADMFDCSIPNNTLSRAELNYDIGEIKSVHYGDILVKYGAVTDATKDEIPFITNGDIAKYKRHFLNNGDIIIADTAEDETVGKATEIVGISDDYVVSGLHTIVCRPKAEMQENFLGYYMNSSAYHRQLLPLMQGIKVLAISRSNLAKTTVSYPVSSEEQRKVGMFFKHLDNLITQQQRKLEKTKALKSAYLSEMFPAEGEREPKRRFAGFTQAWEQRKLGDLAKVRTGKAFSSADFNDDGEYLVVTNKNIQDEANGIISVGDRIDISEETTLNNYLLNGENILVTMDGVNIGKTGKYSNEKAVLAQRVGRLNSDQLEFVYQVTNNNKFVSQMNKLSVGNAIKHISLKQISDYSFAAPINEKEQEKIGSFFKQIDDIITLHQRKLKKLQNTKKAYLNEMFV